MTIAYSDKINRLPESDGLDFANKISVEILPILFSSDVDETIAKVKENYQGVKNTLFRPSSNRAEQCLFRLYEAKHLILPHCDIDLMGFCFDHSYHDFVVKAVSEGYDRALGEREYETALSAVRQKDYLTAGQHFKNAALCGHVDAQYNYGVSLSNGELGEADPLEGAFWYFSAAKGGNAKAMVNLAIAYRRGVGVLENGPMMLYWYAKGATVPFPYAVYCLGLCLKDEEVISNNVSLGRILIVFSERLCDDRVCDFAKQTACQIIEALKDHTYNI